VAEIRIERRRGPSLWPWLAGLIVLALLIWAIAELVNTDRDNQTMVEADTLGALVSTAPMQTAPGPGDGESAMPATPKAGAGPAPLQDLMPLGIQDAGQQVTADGIVVSRAARGGFWMNVGGNTVLWVSGNLRVVPRQAVQGVTGTLRPFMPAALSAWTGATDIRAQAARHSSWQLQTSVYLDTSPAGARLGADTGAGASQRHAARRVSRSGAAHRHAARRVSRGRTRRR
jgi:hypothetical protein